MSLKDYTIAQLEEELKRQKRVLVVPYPRPSREFKKHSENVYRLGCRYITDLARDGHVDDDLEGYIFEAVITAIFGENVWDYVNEVLK